MYLSPVLRKGVYSCFKKYDDTEILLQLIFHGLLIVLSLEMFVLGNCNCDAGHKAPFCEECARGYKREVDDDTTSACVDIDECSNPENSELVKRVISCSRTKFQAIIVNLCLFYARILLDSMRFCSRTSFDFSSIFHDCVKRFWVISKSSCGKLV